MKRVLVRVFKREDQTLVHIVTMYVTLLLASVYAVIFVALN